MVGCIVWLPIRSTSQTLRISVIVSRERHASYGYFLFLDIWIDGGPRPSSCVAEYLVVIPIYLRPVRQLRTFHRRFSRLHLLFFELLKVLTILKIFSFEPSAFQDPRPISSFGKFWRPLCSWSQVIHNLWLWLLIALWIWWISQDVCALGWISRSVCLDDVGTVFITPTTIARNLTSLSDNPRHNTSTRSLYLSDFFHFAVAIALCITTDASKISIWWLQKNHLFVVASSRRRLILRNQVGTPTCYSDVIQYIREYQGVTLRIGPHIFGHPNLRWINSP